jgi:two-component system, cell cycle sensor histidine kinase and response regulator CckA
VSQFRILVVEDDMVQSMVLYERLAKLGYNVIGCLPRGEEAIKQVHDDPPDLVLMDIKLAGEMNGIQAATQIRSQYSIPVVFISAHADQNLIQLAKETEPLGFLVKPYGEQQLAAAIEVALFKAQMEKRITESEGKFRGITENSSDITFVLDSSLIIKYSSPAISKVFGYTESELMGSSIKEFIHPEDWEKFSISIDMDSDSDSNTAAIDHFRIKTKSDRYSDLEGKITHLLDQPGVMGIVVNCRDIAERIKIQELLIETSKYKAVADVAAGIAHNFNNLLQVILGNADLALMSLGSGTFGGLRENIQQIKESCSIGAETIKRLSNYALYHQIETNFTREAINIGTIIENAIDLTRYWWEVSPEEKGYKINIISDIEDNCMVYGNKAALFESILNLIKNAIEALAAGGEIELSCKKCLNQIEIRIKDSGPGIPDEHIHKLFNPFFTTKYEVGRGLGLATTRIAIQAHGGNIRVISSPESGTSFIVRLPLVE